MLHFSIVNAFVHPNRGQFSGNPAAVVLLDKDTAISDEQKQLIGAQFNLAETAFVSPIGDSSSPDEFLIRWFSPTNEVELCGHATLATSYVLHTELSHYPSLGDTIKYRTAFGAHLETTFDRSADSLTLNFPLNIPVSLENSPFWLEQLKSAVIGSEDDPQLAFTDAQLAPNGYLLLRLNDDAPIEQLKPDYSRMVAVDTGDTKIVAVLVTKRAHPLTDGAHFISRVFGPWVGILEDPVTGSSFTVLTPYWCKVYREELGQSMIGKPFRAVQASPRSGLVFTELTASADRVLVTGAASKFASGTFQVQ